MNREWLDRLSSAAKYPSIDNYHVVGMRGEATEEIAVALNAPDEPLFVTEKIDGTNARIIIPPDISTFDGPTYFIGSRTELLTAAGDVVANPALGIVDVVEEFAEEIDRSHPSWPHWTVFYGEVYGKGIAGGQRYGGAAPAFRLFDVAMFPDSILDMERERIASWRDNEGPIWCDVWDLLRIAGDYNLGVVPALVKLDPGTMPERIDETLSWLQEILPETKARLGLSGTGRPEGVVVRTLSRRHVAKVRFEQYEKAQRLMGAK